MGRLYGTCLGYGDVATNFDHLVNEEKHQQFLSNATLRNTMTLEESHHGNASKQH